MNTEEQAPQPEAGQSLGQRLKGAREAMGLSVAQVGERLRLPIAMVEAMERDDLERLGAPIYARGHLGGYARLVGVPAVLVDARLASAAPPPLKTTARVSRSHYLIDRYARRAVYVVLTASIVLPVVWLATRDQLPHRALLVQSLDQRADTGVAAGGTELPVQERAREAPALPVQTREPPVVASLTPFYTDPSRRAEAAPVPQPPPQAEPAAQPDTLQIVFEGPSWVEVVARDGTRLAFGLVAAGEQRSFPAERVASVAIGDADAVQVSLGDATVDLAPYRRAKVARFALSSDGLVNPVGG